MSDDVLEFVDQESKEYQAGFSAGYAKARHDKSESDFSKLDLKAVLETAAEKISSEVAFMKGRIDDHEKSIKENDAARHILAKRIALLEKTVSRHLKHSVHWEYHEGGESDEKER